MATETTRDATINFGGIPQDEQANLAVQTLPDGTLVTNKGDTTGMVATVTGNLGLVGGTLREPRFFLVQTPGAETPIPPPTTLSFDLTQLFNTRITQAPPPPDNPFPYTSTATVYGSVSIVTGIVKATPTTITTNTKATYGSGSDSVSFLQGSLDKGSTHKMGGGSDSITFGKRSASKRARIALGKNDNSKDVVDIHKKAEVKKLKITEFGKEDTLKIGGKTFDYDQLQDRDGKVGKNITIKFD